VVKNQTKKRLVPGQGGQGEGGWWVGDGSNNCGGLNLKTPDRSRDLNPSGWKNKKKKKQKKKKVFENGSKLRGSGHKGQKRQSNKEGTKKTKPERGGGGELIRNGGERTSREIHVGAEGED